VSPGEGLRCASCRHALPPQLDGDGRGALSPRGWRARDDARRTRRRISPTSSNRPAPHPPPQWDSRFAACASSWRRGRVRRYRQADSRATATGRPCHRTPVPPATSAARQPRPRRRRFRRPLRLGCDDRGAAATSAWATLSDPSPPADARRDRRAPPIVLTPSTGFRAWRAGEAEWCCGGIASACRQPDPTASATDGLERPIHGRRGSARGGARTATASPGARRRRGPTRAGRPPAARGAVGREAAATLRPRGCRVRRDPEAQDRGDLRSSVEGSQGRPPRPLMVVRSGRVVSSGSVTVRSRPTRQRSMRRRSPRFSPDPFDLGCDIGLSRRELCGRSPLPCPIWSPWEARLADDPRSTPTSIAEPPRPMPTPGGCRTVPLNGGATCSSPP
jgi:hypothetical protein